MTPSSLDPSVFAAQNDPQPRDADPTHHRFRKRLLHELVDGQQAGVQGGEQGSEVNTVRLCLLEFCLSRAMRRGSF